MSGLCKLFIEDAVIYKVVSKTLHTVPDQRSGKQNKTIRRMHAYERMVLLLLVSRRADVAVGYITPIFKSFWDPRPFFKKVLAGRGTASHQSSHYGARGRASHRSLWVHDSVQKNSHHLLKRVFVNNFNTFASKSNYFIFRHLVELSCNNLTRRAGIVCYFLVSDHYGI